MARVDTDLPKHVGNARPIAHQSTSFDKGAVPVHDWDCVLRCQGSDWCPKCVKQRAWRDHESIDFLLHEGRKGRNDPTIRTVGNEWFDLHPDGRSPGLQADDD